MSVLRRAISGLGLASHSSGVREDRRLGRSGERAAAGMLRRKGFRILGRNVRVKFGEADLVAIDPDGRTIVVVEVKTRRLERILAANERRAAPAPEMSVHNEKRRKLLAIARYLAKANGWRGRPIRIDVVAIDWPPSGKPVIRHRVSAASGR